jgi:GGDEF domain-containing protein
VARFGPDCFLAVLNGASGELAAEAAAQILRQVSGTQFTDARGETVTVTMSTVCARYRDGERLDATIRAIESALESGTASGPGAFKQI